MLYFLDIALSMHVLVHPTSVFFQPGVSAALISEWWIAMIDVLRNNECLVLETPQKRMSDARKIADQFCQEIYHDITQLQEQHTELATNMVQTWPYILDKGHVWKRERPKLQSYLQNKNPEQIIIHWCYAGTWCTFQAATQLYFALHGLPVYLWDENNYHSERQHLSDQAFQKEITKRQLIKNSSRPMSYWNIFKQPLEFNDIDEQLIGPHTHLVGEIKKTG